MTRNEPALANQVSRASLPGAAQRWLDRALPRDHDLPSSIQYDLIVVLTSMPQALEPYGVTYIDGRLTDLISVTAAQLEAISLLEKAVDGEAWLGRIIRWFERGDIRFDRSGRLVRIQKQVQGRPWIKPLDKPGREAWREINYNLAQSKRLCESEDPVYLVAADLRLALYGPADLLFNYFHIRNIAWEGEKAAVRYLMAHDPAYLELLRAFIREGERERNLSYTVNWQP